MLLAPAMRTRVKAAREGYNAVRIDETMGRSDAKHAAARRGDAHAACCVSAQREVHLA